MKNKLIDLNNHLFAQLERLSEEETRGEDLQEEVCRAKAISSIAKDIVNNGRLALDAEKALQNNIISSIRVPGMLVNKTVAG